jgi:hypothetical protein
VIEIIKYTIVLKSGIELKCFTEHGVDSIVEMMLQHNNGIYIVQENTHPDHVTYLMPDKVSHFRFMSNSKDVGNPM